MKTKKPPHVLVAFTLESEPGALVIQTNMVVTRMSDEEGTKWFTTPPPDPPLATMTTAAADLLEKHTNAQDRAAGKHELELKSQADLEKLLRKIKRYVQGRMDDNAGFEAVIAAAAGMGVAGHGGGHKREHAVEQDNSGVVRYTIPAFGRRGAVLCQASSDGGKTWPNQIFTDEGVAEFKNLTVGVEWSFRHQITINGKASDWSQVLKLIVR